MKLVSLYIEGFGKMSQYSYDFSDGLNSIYEENGWGKTTLTIFIKSMLYGISKSDRAMYYPWINQTIFGGYLIVEVNNKQYRIYRNFDQKKPANDICKLYDMETNLEVECKASTIGEMFLNLNEESFERSVFIPQKEIEEGFGSDIEAKLANLIGGTDDSQSYDEACAILNKKIKLLKTNSKNGLIIDLKKNLYKIEDEIADCESKIDGISVIKKNIEQVNKEINELEDSKKEINSKIIEYSRNQGKIAKLAVRDKYIEDINQKKKELKSNNEIFNGVNVTIDEINEIRAKNKRIITLKTEAELSKKNDKTSTRLEQIKGTIDFNGNVPSDEKIERIVKCVEKHQKIKLLGNSNVEAKEPKKQTLSTILAAISSLLLLVGILLIVFHYLEPLHLLVPAIICIALAVVGYIVAVISHTMVSSYNSSITYKRVSNYDFELRALEEDIREFFSKYRLYSSDFNNTLFIIRSSVERYKEAIADLNQMETENKELEEEIQELEQEVLSFINQFNTTAATIEEKIGQLNTRLHKKNEIEKSIVNKKTELKQYITLNGLDQINEDEIDIEQLNKELNDIDEKISGLNKIKATNSNSLLQYENDISIYEDLVSQKDELSARIIKLEEEYRLLALTSNYLNEAQTSLLLKYVSPMKKSVNKYVSLLLKNTKNYSIDVNFKFQFITSGGLKGLESYSKGYQAIISLCMRLALIDCLYPNEKPFIILDDPFVNFDDDKLQICKDLIKDVAGNYQIMYFTCHNSRAVK